MSDRIDEIRARLTHAEGQVRAVETADGLLWEVPEGDADLIANAPADIAYLLAEVDRLNAVIADPNRSARMLALYATMKHAERGHDA